MGMYADIQLPLNGVRATIKCSGLVARAIHVRLPEMRDPEDSACLLSVICLTPAQAGDVADRMFFDLRCFNVDGVEYAQELYHNQSAWASAYLLKHASETDQEVFFA